MRNEEEKDQKKTTITTAIVLVFNVIDPEDISGYQIHYPYNGESDEDLSAKVKAWIKSRDDWAFLPFVTRLGDFVCEDEEHNLYEFSDYCVRKSNIDLKVTIP